MPRKIRLEYPGATYHVVNRGDKVENIFLDDVDRHDFLKTLADACQKTGWQVHAYCLMLLLPVSDLSAFLYLKTLGISLTIQNMLAGL
jgi:hypothetical protein